MGVGQSSEKEKNAPPISSNFSSLELKKLEEFFQFKEQAAADQENISRKWNYANIKLRINESFSEEISSKIIKYMQSQSMEEGGEEGVVLESFLVLVFHLTKDCIKDLSEILFHIVGQGDQIVRRESMQKFLTQFVTCLSHGTNDGALQFSSDETSSEKLSEKLVEQCPDNMKVEDFDLALHRSPLLIDILQYKFRMLFFDYVSEASTKDIRGSMPYLIPNLDILDKSANQGTFIISLPTAIYINSKVPMQLQHKWRLLYSSKLHGESFSKLTGAILNKGPTLLVIKDTNGHVFGGFASTSWQFSSEFQGTDRCFLFTCSPTLQMFDCMGGSYNNHYMYLNTGQEMMPNGLGMGGQFDFFGLWLDQEFGKGHSRAKPKCTTYKSPQLSKDENFKIEAITVWGVGEEPQILDNEEYNEDMTSVLDKHIEAKALLEIAGKPRVSEGLRDIEPDSDIPETKELQHAHDPMG